MKPWQISASHYQRLKGVHQPHICEISPWQYSQMGKQQKAAYDKKRAAEWNASAEVKSEWAQLLLAAYDRGEVDLTSTDTHEEAREYIRLGLRCRKEAEKKVEFEKARLANQIRSVDEVSVGDRVFDIMGSRYGVITKKNRQSVRFRPDVVAGCYDPGEYKTGPGALLWLKYDDLKARVDNAA